MSLHFRVLNDKDMYFIPTNVFSIFILVYVSCDLCNMNLKNMRKQKQTHNLQFLSKKKQRYNALRSSPTQFEKMHSAIQYAVPNAIQGLRKPSKSGWDSRSDHYQISKLDLIKKTGFWKSVCFLFFSHKILGGLKPLQPMYFRRPCKIGRILWPKPWSLVMNS